MNVEQKYINKIAAAETVFDMAVICYKILEDEIPHPVAFISQYIDESDENGALKFDNPNYCILRSFSDQVSEELEKYSEFDFLKQKNDIVNLMKGVSLDVFLEEKENQLSVVFTLLSTIDSLIPSWSKKGIIGREALNRGKSRKNYFVYPACGECIHEALIQEIGRERKREDDIGETLNNLLFIKKEKLPKGAMPPEICLLSRKKTEDPLHIKVAVITGLQGDHFKISRIHGSARVIEYVQKAQSELAGRIWRKMRAAIRSGAEFIILPEFCVSEEILEHIKRELSEWKQKEDESSNLVAVFPGSTWVDTNDNVQFILNAWGKEIGQYYKNTPFRKRKRGVGGYQSCESLTHPGYRTSLLRIDGLGYILPATCRDVIDGIYTGYFVSRFHPSFIFVPAWSASGSSFEQPLKRYAMDYYTNSILCNGCGALKRKTSVVGGAVIPTKNKTAAAGYFRAIRQTEAMAEGCAKRCDKLCSYMLEMDFGDNNANARSRVSCQKY